MNASGAASIPASEADTRTQATLRFGAAVTAAFVACEFLQWMPSFLAPVLTAALLANLPMRLPLKLGLVLVATMAVASLFAFALASLMRGTPFVLFVLVALCMFLAFHALLTGRPALPCMLLLICLAIIPVVVMVAPSQAGVLPKTLIRGIWLAVVMIWCAYLAWPRNPAPKPPAPAAGGVLATPERRALVSTAVMMPLVLAYLLFGLVDVLPVLMGTVMIVVTFDLQSGRVQALRMIVGNFAGGVLGVLLHSVLLTNPVLPVLALLLFPVLLWFGHHIAAGGAQAPVYLIACNAMLIILSTAIASGTGSLSLWVTRLLLFAFAGAFAVGMMHLVGHRVYGPRPVPPRSMPR